MHGHHLLTVGIPIKDSLTQKIKNEKNEGWLPGGELAAYLRIADAASEELLIEIKGEEREILVSGKEFKQMSLVNASEQMRISPEALTEHLKMQERQCKNDKKRLAMAREGLGISV